MYKFEFFSKPNIIDKESYFIPAGYDSLSLLNSFDVQNDLSKIYSERINSSKSITKPFEDEIMCEDSQAFMKKFYGQQPSIGIGQTSRNKAEKQPSENTFSQNAYQTQPTHSQNSYYTKDESSKSIEPQKQESFNNNRIIHKEINPSQSNFSTERPKIQNPKEKTVSKPTEKISASEQLKKRLADLKNINK